MFGQSPHMGKIWQNISDPLQKGGLDVPTIGEANALMVQRHQLLNELEIGIAYLS